jgi:hypothetical protein
VIESLIALRDTQVLGSFMVGLLVLIGIKLVTSIYNETTPG